MTQRFPHVSRATVYNTVNLFVETELVRQFALTDGRVIFDPKIDGFEVREYQVVIRGNRTSRTRGKKVY